MFVDRFITKVVLKALKVSPVVFLNGGRQAGKSTLVLNSLSEIDKKYNTIYIAFDKATQMAAAASSSKAILSAYYITLWRMRFKWFLNFSEHCMHFKLSHRGWCPPTTSACQPSISSFELKRPHFQGGQPY